MGDKFGKTFLCMGLLFSGVATAQYDELTWVKKQVGGGTNGRMSDDCLGSAVSLSEDILVVGAPYQDYDSSGSNPVSNAGAVFIYSRNQGGANNWGLVKRLTGASAGNNGRLAGDNFGTSVAISDEIVVVGAYAQDYNAAGLSYMLNAGAAYVFYKDQGGRDNWGFVKKLSGQGTNGRGISDMFGWSVSISGDIIVIGALGQDYDTSGSNYEINTGAAYVFHKNQGGADNWGFVKKLTGVGTNGRVFTDQFGRSVSVSGNIIVVGAAGQDFNESGADSVSDAGAAYVFYKDQGGTDNWGFVRKLCGSGTNGRLSRDNFGFAVSISGYNVAIAAKYQDYDASGSNAVTDAGAVYRFYKTAGGTDNWGLMNKITGGGSNGRVAYDYFGSALSLSGDILVVGAYGQDFDGNGTNSATDAGAAYVYYSNKGGTNNWGLVKKISGEGAYGRYSGDQFGWSVAVSGMQTIVGANQQEYDQSSTSGVNNAGAAYLFESSFVYGSGGWLPTIPTSGTGAYNCSIHSGTLFLPSGGTVNNLWIASGVLAYVFNSQNFSVTGNYVNNGLVAGVGELILKGTSTQNISGTGSTEKLILSNPYGATIVADSLKITRELVCVSGTLTTNGKLVLKAGSNTFYGQISATGTGSISGALAVEKLLSNTNAGWRQIGIPVSTTIGNLKGIDLLGSAHGTANERNIYYWDATASSGNTAKGWVAVSTSTANNSQAYVVYGNNSNGGFHDIASMWRISGSYVTGNQNFTLVASDDPNGGSSPHKTGWNLVPNPYASNLAVNQLWGASGFPSYKAIHVWDAVNGQYVGICSTGVSVNTYNNGGGTSSATILQPYQAFWVKTSANQTLTLTNGMRTTSITGAGVFMKKDYPTLRLTLTDENEHRDQVVVYFHPEGQEAFNEATDAYKLFSMDGEVPSLHLCSKTTGPLSIKALAEGMDSAELPISIQNPLGRTVRLVPDRSELPAEWDVYLKDKRDGSLRLLRVGDTITCDPGKESEGELFLVLKKKQSPGMGVEEEAVSSQLVVGSDGTTLWIAGKNLSWESSAYRVYDLSGRNMFQGTLQLSDGIGTVELGPFERGVYIIWVEQENRSYRGIRR